MLRSRSRNFWKGWNRESESEIWKVGVGNFGKVGVRYFASNSATLLPYSVKTVVWEYVLIEFKKLFLENDFKILLNGIIQLLRKVINL